MWAVQGQRIECQGEEGGLGRALEQPSGQVSCLGLPAAPGEGRGDIQFHLAFDIQGAKGKLLSKL